MLEIFYKMQPLDYVYLLVGIILFIFAIQSFLDKEHKYRIGTGLFWLLYSVSFIFGSYLSKEINGWLVIAMAASQNVVKAIDGGVVAILAGVLAVAISFVFVPILSKMSTKGKEV